MAQFPGLNAKGPSVTLVHGIAASAATWLPLAIELAPFCKRFYIPDIPGHGLSPAPKSPFSCIDAYEITRDAILRSIDPLETHVLVGNSLGGAFALKLLLDFPNEFQKAVLISPAGAPFPHSAKEVIAPFLPDTIAQAKNIVDRVFVHPTKIHEALLAPLLKASTASPGFRSMLQSIADIDENPDNPLSKLIFTPEQISKIHLPLMLIWGGNDKILPIEMRNFFDKYLPQNAIRVFDADFGHCPQFDAVKPLARILAPFIRHSNG